VQASTILCTLPRSVTIQHISGLFCICDQHRGRERYIAAVSAETDVSAMTNPTVNETGNTQGGAGASFGRERGRGHRG